MGLAVEVAVLVWDQRATLEEEEEEEAVGHSVDQRVELDCGLQHTESQQQQVEGQLPSRHRPCFVVQTSFFGWQV